MTQIFLQHIHYFFNALLLSCQSMFLLAPTGAQGVTIFVRLSGSSLSRALNLQAISQQSVSSQLAVRQQS